MLQALDCVDGCSSCFKVVQECARRRCGRDISGKGLSFELLLHLAPGQGRQSFASSSKLEQQTTFMDGSCE